MAMFGNVCICVSINLSSQTLHEAKGDGRRHKIFLFFFLLDYEVF